MAHAPSPLITSARLGHGLPDRVQVSIFTGEHVTDAEAAQVRRYLSVLPGTVPDEDDEDSAGPGYTRRVGDLLCKFRVGSWLSMSATFNPQQRIVQATGLASPDDDDDNTVLPLVAHGYDLDIMRECMCDDIADRVARAKAIFLETYQKALGAPVTAVVQANVSSLEVDYDSHGDADQIASYDRAFRKVIIPHRRATGPSGSLKKGEKFAIYLKRPTFSPTPIVRFEMAISGAQIKKLTGTQRVPDSGPAIERLLTAVEARYLPVWLLIERHRSTRAALTYGEFARRLPRIKNVEALERLAEQLGRTGRVGSRGNHNHLAALRRSGLIENLGATTKVRGYRVTTPESDAHWQRWRLRP